MADDDGQYEFMSTRAVRGTETRAIAKWQKAGWELVNQTSGTLRTTLNFRRVKPKVPWLPIAVLGSIVLLLVMIGGIVVALQGGDGTAPASTKPATESSGTTKPDVPESSAPGPEQVLTRQNNKEFAALLATSDYCDETIGAFAAKYENRTIEFDGSIAAMANHAKYETRYDILVSPGDEGPKSGRGPALKFEDVNVLDLHLTGANAPDAVGVGDLVHVVARVGKFNPNQCLFFLDPVSTGVRQAT